MTHPDGHGEPRSDLDFRKLLLLTIIETYFPLKTRKEKRRFQELTEKPEYRQVREFRQSWIDLLTRSGLLEAKRSTLLRQISAKFGLPSEELVWRIRCLKSIDELDGHLDKVLTARSLGDMGPLAPTDSATAGKSSHENTQTMSDLERYRKFMMLGLVDSLTPAETSEEERLFKDVTLKPEYRYKGTFCDTWAEEMMMNGLLEGKRSTLLRQLDARFGFVPKRVVQRIHRLKSLDDLDTLLDHVLTARSLEDLRDLKAINRNAKRLNEEAEDVLRYQAKTKK